MTRLAACASYLLLCSIAHAAIQPAVTTNRTEGVAPLAVFFDASATEADGEAAPFHTLAYEWDFGETTDELWPISSMSRNRAIGPVAAHVYDTEGTYTVTLTVSDGEGRTASRSTTVTVHAQSSTFGGGATVCFSRNADFDGAPEGAERVTVAAFEEIAPYVASGTRLLLKRGQTFPASDNVSINVEGPGIIGSFGAGDDPVVAVSGGSDVFTISGSTPRARDWRIMDLEIDGSGGDGVSAVVLRGTADDMLLYNLNVHETKVGVSASLSILNYWNGSGDPGHTLHDALAIVGCTVRDLRGGGGGNGSYIAAGRFIFLGNTYTDSRQVEHVLRTPWISTGVLSHNHLSRAASTKHIVKMHAPKFNEGGLGEGRYTEKVVLSDNEFIAGDLEDWPVVLGPQDAGSDERLRNLIIERNYFTSGADANVLLRLSGAYSTVRNNVFNGAGGGAVTCVGISNRGSDPVPHDVAVVNNTAYHPGDASITMVALGDGGAIENVTIRNNLAAGGQAAVLSGTGTGIVRDHNLETASPGFVAAAPASAADFMLSASSPARDGGTEVSVWYDFTGATRAAGQPYDIGAFEHAAQTTARRIPAHPTSLLPSVWSVRGVIGATGSGHRARSAVYTLRGRRLVTRGPVRQMAIISVQR